MGESAPKKMSEKIIWSLNAVKIFWNRQKQSKKRQAKGNMTGYRLMVNDAPVGNLPYGQFAK